VEECDFAELLQLEREIAVFAADNVGADAYFAGIIGGIGE
jgi:hypothetical protein